MPKFLTMLSQINCLYLNLLNLNLTELAYVSNLDERNERSLTAKDNNLALVRRNKHCEIGTMD